MVSKISIWYIDITLNDTSNNKKRCSKETLINSKLTKSNTKSNNNEKCAINKLGTHNQRSWLVWGEVQSCLRVAERQAGCLIARVARDVTGCCCWAGVAKRRMAGWMDGEIGGWLGLFVSQRRSRSQDIMGTGSQQWALESNMPNFYARIRSQIAPLSRTFIQSSLNNIAKKISFVILKRWKENKVILLPNFLMGG